MQFRTVEFCCVCEGPVQAVIDLPRLPLTGIYSGSGQVPDFPTLDQSFMFCPACSHGQLLRMIDPKALYGHEYGFRTSTSETARRSVAFFADYLARLFPQRRFARVLEFGCSDAVLLNSLRDRASRLLGVDPVLKEREAEFSDGPIAVMGAMIEEIDVQSTLGGPPDLIVCQHTLEHLPEPKRILEQLLHSANDDTVFVFEFPCFDPMLAEIRFDHLFHQHVQYFSLRSIRRLLHLVGAEVIDHTIHYTYWGALLIAFRKANERQTGTRPTDLDDVPAIAVDAIRAGYSEFQRQMRTAAQLAAAADKSKLFGYGGALMLPVVGYHLGTDFSEFQAILDDDPAKDGIGYVNLPVKIRSPRQLDFSDLVIFLTALDNRRPILRRLAELNPRQIINPLCVL